jgi:hypothetical protein
MLEVGSRPDGIGVFRMQCSAWSPGVLFLWSVGIGLNGLCGCGGLLGGSSSGEKPGTSSASGGTSTGLGGAGSATGGAHSGGISAATTITGGDSSASACDLAYRNCTDVIRFSPEIRTVNMLLVVDTSALMNDKAQATDTQSRWRQLNTDLSGALRRVENDVDFGLELFPYSTSGIGADTIDPTIACQVPNGVSAIVVDVQPGSSNLTTVLNALSQQVPAGYSPASKALEQAHAYFTVGAGKDLKGTHSVLFVTTGSTDCNTNLSCDSGTCTPNLDQNCPQGDAGVNCCSNAGYLCSDHDAVAAEIGKLASTGNQTYVIGMPASDDEFQMLNTFATAGQATNPSGSQGELFYWVGEGKTGTADLLRAFSTIATQLIRQCDFPLNGTPANPNDVVVQFDCQSIVQDTSGSPNVGNGWVLDWSRDPPHLVVGGAVCNALMASGASQAVIAYNCGLGLQ